MIRLKGEADIVIASGMSEEQKLKVEESGEKLEYIKLYSEPLVFLVNKANNIDNLKIEDIKKIYYNKTSNWKDFGGDDLKINTYQLEKIMGVKQLLKQ